MIKVTLMKKTHLSYDKEQLIYTVDLNTLPLNSNSVDSQMYEHLTNQSLIEQNKHDAHISSLCQNPSNYKLSKSEFDGKSKHSENSNKCTLQLQIMDKSEITDKNSNEALSNSSPSCFLQKTNSKRSIKSTYGSISFQKSQKESSSNFKKSSKVKLYSSILRNRQQSHNRDRPFKCIYCGKAYCEMTNLRRHTRLHTGERPYKCEICFRSFALRNSYKAHLYSHTSMRPFQCVICGKRFKSEATLRGHHRSHSFERSFQCDQCDSVFKSSSSLTIHRISHDATFCVCSVCGKSINSGMLKKHMQAHTSERSHRCKTCGKSFKTKSGLNLHSKLHTGVKPYKCDVCDYASPFIGRLNAHKATHSSSPGLPCFCGKSFKNTKSLHMHLTRQHAGVHIFKCEMCPAVYKSSHDLLQHSHQHTNDTALICAVCKSSFPSKQKLTNHMKGHRSAKIKVAST